LQVVGLLAYVNCFVFQLSAKKITVQLQDGTFIDDEDYFQTIPAQTLFLLVQPGEYAPTGMWT